MVLSAIPAWQVDAALFDLERSMRRSRPTRLVRAMLKCGFLSAMVLAAVLFVVAGRLVLGVTLATSAVLLADGRPARYLGKIRRGRLREPGGR